MVIDPLNPCGDCGSRTFMEDRSCALCGLSAAIRAHLWPKWLPTLAANLAWGAALCRAYRIGRNPQQRIPVPVGVAIDIWKPGCRRPAP